MTNTIKVTVCHGSLGIINGDGILETIATIINWVVIVGYCNGNWCCISGGIAIADALKVGIILFADKFLI